MIRRAAMKRTWITLVAIAGVAGCGAKAAPPTATTTAPPAVTAAGDDRDDDDAVDEAATGEDHGHHHHADDADAPPQVEPPPAPRDAAQAKADLLPAEDVAYQAARPVFATYCAACHQQGGKKATAKKLGHFDMTTYPFGGHHAAEIASAIREVLGVDGGKPTMPSNKPGVVQGDELALIVAWAAAWEAAQAGGAHPDRPTHGH